MWDGIKWHSGAQLQYVRDFVLSIGLAYRDLVPHRELLSPNETGPARGFRGWAFAARTDDLRHFLTYFEAGRGQPRLSGAQPGAAYAVKALDPATGEWREWAGGYAVADQSGAIRLPEPPVDRVSRRSPDQTLGIFQPARPGARTAKAWPRSGSAGQSRVSSS